MLRGDHVGLRARHTTDVQILKTELYDDVETRSRASSRAWIPVPPALDDQPFGVQETSDSIVIFTVVDLATDEVAGSAQLWGIDLHNRLAHLGLTLRPSFRGRGLGSDALRVLVRYGFATRGLHRLSIETLADNQAMIHAARTAGFTHEGTHHEAAWVNGQFQDEVAYGLLAP